MGQASINYKGRTIKKVMVGGGGVGKIQKKKKFVQAKMPEKKFLQAETEEIKFLQKEIKELL